MCAPFPERRALLSVATFPNSSSRLKGIASFSSFPGFCSDDAFGFTPFFFEYDNVGFEPYPVAVQNVFAAYVGWGRADWWVGMWRGWFLSLCVFVGGRGE